LTQILRYFYIGGMLFIHQYPDWTNFRYSLQAVSEPLARIHFLQGVLQGKLFFARDAERLSKARTRELEAIFRIAERPEVPQVFYAAARNFAMPMTEKRLLALHASLVENGGRYRETADAPGKDLFHGFRGVPWERIPQEMARFFRFFDGSPMDGVLKANLAHFWLSAVRPFASGNGVLSRILCDMLLSRSENSSVRCYVLNEEILKDRDGYFEALSRAERSSGDVTEWILWFLSKMETALLNAEREWSAEFEASRRRLFLGGVSLSEREQGLVRYLEEHPGERLSSSLCAKISGVSHDSALRDLKSLVEKGVLSKLGGKGRNTRYELA
jgi:Fic family protein